MEDEKNQANISRYLEDIQVIKNILAKNEEKTLLEPWAFHLWAAVVAIGTVIHYVAYRASVPHKGTLVLLVWIVVVIIGSVGETVGWLRMFRREETPLFSLRFIRFILTAIALLLVMSITLITLLAHGALSPGLLLVIVTMPMVFYAQISYAQLYIEAFILLGAGLVLVLVDVSVPAAYVFAGLLTAAAMAGAGFHSKVLERERSE